MKHIFFLSFLCAATLCAAQTEKITKLLNTHFQQEQQLYDEDDETKPALVQPFQIQNDTLSYTIKYTFNSGEEMEITRKVNLNDIEEFIKDYHVIFVAKPETVTEIETIRNEKGEVLEVDTRTTHLFFTELYKNSKDEQTIRKQMRKAFEKAGYTISSEYWYN